MKKITPAILLVFILTLSFACSAAAVDICINGFAIQFDDDTGTPFIDGNNRTQVPLRQTMEAFGAKVSWNAGLRQAIVAKNGITVTVPIDHYHILIGNVQKDTDTAAMIVNNRTFLPIRAVAEAFGASVSWDGTTVNITTYEGMYSYTPAQAQSIALLHAEYTHADVVFVDTSLVYQNSWVFLLTFYADDITYHYVIDANTGQVLSHNTTDEVPEDMSSWENAEEITSDMILSRAISYAGLEHASDVQMTNLTESTNGISTLYVVTLTSDGYTYVLEINGDTGEVRQLELSYTAPVDDDLVYDDAAMQDSYNNSENDVDASGGYDDAYDDSDSYSEDNAYDYDESYNYDDSYDYDETEDNSYDNVSDFDDSYEENTYIDNPADYDYGYEYGDAGSFDDYDFNFGNDW